jgi:uncharacterized membrane protein YeaQ/YmgE (transglycosylase-associated protein family)
MNNATDGSSGADELDRDELRYTMLITIVSLGVLAGLFVASMIRWKNASDVADAMTVIAGVIGTLAGVHIGSRGRTRAEAERRRAEAALRDHLRAASQTIKER